MSALLAFDKFKGSLTQSELTEIVENHLSTMGIESESILMADGGDGSVAALIKLGWHEKTLEVTGPLDDTHSARFAVSPDRKKVAIELAELCGIKYLNGRLAPLSASSSAIGEAIVKVNPIDFDELVVCLGGSASVDGGTGLLQSIGVKITDSHGEDIRPGLAGMSKSRSIDVSSLHYARSKYIGDCKIRVLSDTSASLTGRRGAAFSFGQQKGLSFWGVIRAELALLKWKRIASAFSGAKPTNTPGDGCAGGIGFAFRTLLGAEIESGSDFFLHESGAIDAIQRSSMVVTGEGRIDQTTLSGKSIFPILELARKLNRKVILICGSANETTLRHLMNHYPIVEVIRLSDFNKPLHELISNARVLLKEALKKIPVERWSQ